MTEAYIHWDINPEIVNIFGFSLRYYGILFAGGILLCATVLKWMFRREGIGLDKLDTLTIYGVVGIFLGARLAHCLFYEPAYYLSHPLEILLPVQISASGGFEFIGYQGLASHGGAAGLFIALVLYTRKCKEPFIRTLDMIGVVSPLGGLFIRLANLMNSEIVGFPTDVPWAFVFVREDNLPRHPAQLYEALAYAAIFLLLLYLYITRRSLLQSGFFFGLSIALIFLARFFIEFVKERQVAFEQSMPLDMGQLLSIPFIVGGVVMIVYGIRKDKVARAGGAR